MQHSTCSIYITAIIMAMTVVFMLISSISAVGADLANTSPIGKVLELLSSLEVKIIREGERDAEVFRDFFQWCKKASTDLDFEIKSYATAKAKQEAKVAEFASNIEVATSKIADLSGAIAKSEVELKQAAGIRLKESANFESSEKELVESIDTLSRALSIISTKISQNPAALAQIDKTSMASLMQSLHLVVEAAAFSSADQAKLVALVQASADDDELGAPSSAAYSSQSSGIVDMLGELKDKAEEELSDARRTEAKSQHNFQMMKMSLEDQMSADTKDLNDEKAAVADAEDTKAKIEGDLAITVPDLKDNKASLETSHQDCMQSAADHEATMSARKEELSTIEKAKTILREAISRPSDKKDEMCQCISRSCSTGAFTAKIKQHRDSDDAWGAWCFTRGNCNSLNQQSVEECPGTYWARLQEGAFEPEDGEEQAVIAEDKAAAFDKDDEMCECISRTCSTGTFEAEVMKHKDSNDAWGEWCFTRGNCNSLNQQSVEECPGSYWARASEGAVEPQRTSQSTHEVADGSPDPRCMCASQSCSTGTFEAEIQPHDDANPDWGSWCFTAGDCHSLNQKSMEECPGSYWARASEGAVEPERTSHSAHSVSNEALDTRDSRCQCTSRSCSTGTFEAEIRVHDEANSDWGAWCFTEGNCHSMNQKSVEECSGSHWARASEGAFEPQAASLFLQLTTASGATAQTRADGAHSEIISMVEKLARNQHSSALAQLASRIAVVAKYGRQHGANPYEKIKALISGMIEKIQKQMNTEATEKSYCNEQIAKTEAKKEELDFDVANLATKIDQAVARAADFKYESKVLHKDVALASKTVAELRNLRSKEHVNYLTAKGDLDRGMASVQKALELLRNYYGTADQEAGDSAALLEQPVQPQHHAKATGAGRSIIQVLEVCESDLANGLSKEESEETDAETEYQEVVQEKKVAKMAQEAHLNYNNQQMVSLEKSISQLTSDKQNLDSELSAVVQYYARVKERCVARPEAYEGRATRREAELNGLNEALAILESEASFVQKGRRMRGGVIASR